VAAALLRIAGRESVYPILVILAVGAFLPCSARDGDTHVPAFCDRVAEGLRRSSKVR
jgi:hypothetical protein